MADHDEVQAHRALSEEYLETALAALAAGRGAPAYFNAIHALELALKACLLQRIGSAPKTHNVGGEFAKHFRDKLGPETCRRINRVLMDYDDARYPDAAPRPASEVASAVTFIRAFVQQTLPALLDAPS